MTDINFDSKMIDRKGIYYLTPLNEYQIGNLLGALRRVEDTGDWWWEVVNVFYQTARKYDQEFMRSNWGDVFHMNEHPDKSQLTPSGHLEDLRRLVKKLRNPNNDLRNSLSVSNDILLNLIEDMVVDRGG